MPSTEVGNMGKIDLYQFWGGYTKVVHKSALIKINNFYKMSLW